MFETQKSGNKTSSGEIGLNIKKLASPKLGQDQVPGGVSVYKDISLYSYVSPGAFSHDILVTRANEKFKVILYYLCIRFFINNIFVTFVLYTVSCR